MHILLIRYNFIKIVFFSILFFANFVNAAEIGISENGDLCLVGSLVINGQIEIGDEKKLISNLNHFKNLIDTKCNIKNDIIVLLNSIGGDVDEALKIGKEIRKNSLGVIVQTGGICYSSCVFILAAGVSKSVYGSVGIHRPYFNYLKPGNSMDEIRKKRDIMNQQIKLYLNFVDVPENLLDEMLAYPPESIKILSNNDLLKFRLVGVDATKDELNVAEYAEFFNISSAEYRKRYAAVKKNCYALLGDNMEKYLSCHDSLMLNIPVSLVEQRKAKVKFACSSLLGDQFKACRRKILVFNN